MIVLKSPKGWTGPKVVDGLQIEETFRAHQVTLLVNPLHPDHVKLLEDWMKGYKRLRNCSMRKGDPFKNWMS